MDRLKLFSAFVNGETVVISGYTGKIYCIELEDGSGYSFNIILHLADKNGNKSGLKTVYLRCTK